MSSRVKDNKHYETCDVCKSLEIYEGYYTTPSTNEHYTIPEKLLKSLSKHIGVPLDLYMSVKLVNPEYATEFLSKMLSKLKDSTIQLLLDSEIMEVVGYSRDNTRRPILNSDFIRRTEQLASTCEEVKVQEISYHGSDTKASVFLCKDKSITIEDKYVDKDPETRQYTIGVLLVNDEEDVVSSRLVLYSNGEPLYLPANHYSTTTSRYKRSTTSSLEALEVLVLKVIDDLREESLHDRIHEIHQRYMVNHKLLVSYEEYQEVLRTMRKIPSIIDHPELMNPVYELRELYEDKYTNLESKESSYLWRCTASSSLYLAELIRSVVGVLKYVNAPPGEYFNIRELLGYYISTRRIVEELAREDIR